MTLDRSKAPAVSPLVIPDLPRPSVTVIPGGPRLHILDVPCDAEVFKLTVVQPGGHMTGSRPRSALFSRMLREGSADHTGEFIAETLDASGAWIGDEVSSHHFSHNLFGLVDRAEAVVPLMAEFISRPAFDAERLAVVAEMMAQNAEIADRKVADQASRAVASMVWPTPGHPQAAWASAEGLRAVDRDALVGLHSELWCPPAIDIYLSGHITDSLVDLVTRSFAALPAATAEPKPVVAIPPAESCGDAMRRVVVDGAKQAAISMAIPVIPRSHPDYELLRMAIMALGGYFGSRLMSNLREERGLTYGISSWLQGSLHGGVMGISTECRADAVDEAVEQIRLEIDRMASDPLSCSELDRLRRYMTSVQAATLDSPFSIIQNAVNIITHGMPADYFERQNRVIATATPQMLADIAARYLRLPLSATAIASA